MCGVHVDENVPNFAFILSCTCMEVNNQKYVFIKCFFFQFKLNTMADRLNIFEALNIANGAEAGESTQILIWLPHLSLS